MQEIIVSAHNIRIAYTYNPYVRSVCLGVFVRAGSRYETPEQGGISHMIEHMCFKGTWRRSALQLSKEMDDLGANFNAYTSKEITAYYVQCIDDCIEPAVDLLSDLVLHHTFPADEMAKEKEVVLEEIDMCADTPDDLVSDVAARAHWGDDPLGAPVLGTKDNVLRFTPEDLFVYER
ncbi:MAG: insulinase family protein, partial [Clostridia bacterium]|nr:insulinase family protein [Clostridia bacterium]